MSFTLRPKVFASRAFRAARPRQAGQRCLILLCSLGLLAAGLAPAQSPRNIAPATSQYEVPPEVDIFKREQIQRLARENTERFRMQVTLPSAAFQGPRPRVSNHSTIRNGGGGALAESPPADSVGLVPKLVCVLLGIIVWFLIARKAAPEFAESLTGWLPSFTLRPAVAADRLVTLLAEEKSVAEFQAALRAGAAAAGESSAAPTAEGSPFSAAAGHIREMRRLLEEAGRNLSPASQRRRLVEALDQIRPLKNLASPAESLPLRQMTSAMEMLLKQLTEKAANLTSSTLRTATLGVTLLEELCHPGLKPDLLSEPLLRLLVVDDETFSRYALSHALKRGLTDPDVAENGEFALVLAARHSYDLIVLDVQMPGMDGFELCSKIHETAANRSTPVIFVTSLRDFDARATSILCGGRDLIAKPFLTFELTVKALTLIATERLRGRGRIADDPLEKVATPAPAAPSPTATVPVAEDVAKNFKPDAALVVEPKRLPVIPTLASADNGPAARPKPAAAFFGQARTQIDRMRKLVERIQDTPELRIQQEMITDLFLGAHSLAATAENARQHSIALLASALEGLLKKLLQNTANLSAATLPAVATAVDLIQDLCVSEPGADLATVPAIRALVVDDDPISLRAVSNALQRTFPKPESAADGKTALALAAQMPFDVIFLDVQMPDLDGFEVCAKIRETAANRFTPVVFLTGYLAAPMQAKSRACGGNDFLTKPHLASELNLKALTLALRGRLQNTNGAAPMRDHVSTPPLLETVDAG